MPLMTNKFLWTAFAALEVSGVASFVAPSLLQRPQTATTTSLHMASSMEGEPDDPDLQWKLFQKYHARGSWKGIWTSYDYIGDVLDETVASVDLDLLSPESVTQTHKIVSEAKRSDCATCFDSMQTRDIPVGAYTPETLLPKRVRLAANSMICGPSLLRSGVMATELILSQGDARVRVVFQHAPVWESGVEPGSCPPQGLKLARTMISRECLRDTAPTAETEQVDNPGEQGNPVFYRPVPPFNWHKIWGGTSWTWGPNTGNRGWSIDDLQEGDDWHGNAPVECWNLRLPGGVFVQCPRLITDAEVGLCRLAWLPNDETLLRVEAGVAALQPMVLEDNETMVGFEPPTCTSLRCDVLSKMGDLEGEPSFAKAEKAKAKNEEEKAAEMKAKVAAAAEKAAEKAAARKAAGSASPKPAAASADNKSDSKEDASEPDSGLKAIRDALNL